MQQLGHAGDQPVGVERLGLQGLAAREGQQALGEGGGALGPAHGALGRPAVAAGVLGQGAQQKVEVARDDLQQVVEVVGDPAGELAHRLHLLRLAQALLHLGQLLLAFALGGDVARHAIEPALPGRHRPGHGAVVAVAGPELVLESQGAGPGGELGDLFLVERLLVRMADPGAGAPDDLVLGPAEHARPGGVHAAPDPVQVGHAQKVAGQLPDPVALGGARGDLLFEGLVEALGGLEQAGVVDADGGLGGEALQQALSPLGEHPDALVAEEQPADHLARARDYRRRQVALHRQMALGVSVVGRVLAEARVLRDVVRADDALAAEGRAEHLGVARHGEVGEGRLVDARQDVERVAFAAIVDHVVEERAEVGAGQLDPGVDHRLDQAIEVEFGRHPHGGGVQHLQRLLRPLALGGLVDQAQHAAHRPALVADRRVGDVEEHLFAVAVALDVEGTVLGGDGLAALAHAPQQGLEVVPQLGPVVPRGTAEGGGMLVADGGGVGVVVEGGVVLAPEQDDLDLGRQDQADRVAQFGGPGFRRAEGRGRPVARGDQPADITARPFRH